MYKFVLTLAVIFIGNGCVSDAANGTFWHISDIHIDQNYSRTGDPQHFCHETDVKNDSDIGRYGNFFCDSPEILVNVTIEAMRSYQPNPDFIIWTGDNLPHVWDPNPGWDTVFEALNNITNLLSLTFPGASIFPCIGNHDSFPPDVLLPQPGNDSVYTKYLEEGGWGKIIPPSAWSTFKIGGYYSAPIRTGLRLISLNTILWYMPNDKVKDMKDPANQFQWLEEEFQKAELAKEMVYIIGHVPPGFYNKVALHHSSLTPLTYHQQFLKSYLNVTGKHHAAIAGQFFGHFHLDTFQLFRYGTGVPQSSSLVASSVTPWHSKSLSGLSLPVNPSVRLMHYDQVNGSLTDYNQYFLNLTKANQQPEQTPSYELLYTFTSAYGVPDVSTASLNKLYEKLKSSNETIFKLFNHYMTAGEDSAPCDKVCKTAELCAIICISLEKYLPCMEPALTNTTVAPEDIVTPTPLPSYSSHTTLYAVMGSMIVILVIVSLIAFFRYRKRGPHSPGQYQRFFEF